MDEIIRLGIAAAIALFVIAAVALARYWFQRRLRGFRTEPAHDLAQMFEIERGKSGILYLWGDRCVQCVALQEPALDRLSQSRDVVVRKVKAVAEPDLIKRFGIATVPSTVVIGPDHRIRGVNVGFTDEETLAQQLA